MPKVGKVNLKIKGHLDKYEIHYTQKTMFEIRGVPEEVFRLTGMAKSRYETEQALIDTLHGNVRKYHEMITSERKVIAYRILLPDGFRNTRESRGRYKCGNKMIPDNLKNKISDSNFDVNGLDFSFGFILEYEVLIEVDDNGKKYFYLNDSGDKEREKNVGKNNFIIEYSDAKEQFFKQLELSAKSMVEKLLTFLGQDEQELLAIMESGNQKLLG